jgi:hypothetical protein
MEATRSLGQAFPRLSSSQTLLLSPEEEQVGGVQQTQQDRNTGKKQEKSMDTTVTIEFTAETHHHLKVLEQRLKHIHAVQVNLVEPKGHNAPALIAIGIEKSGVLAERAAQSIAQVLYDFLHEEGQKSISLVTIEGERMDIAPLSIDEIRNILVTAKAGESA